MSIVLGSFYTEDYKENSYKVLGIGINQRPDNNGIFLSNFVTLQQAKYNLINLILTKKGERVGQPEFGCDVWKVLFEPYIEGITETKIDSAITNAVALWLPYLTINEIIFDISNENIDNHNVEIDIIFSLTLNQNISDSVTLTINAQ